MSSNRPLIGSVVLCYLEILGRQYHEKCPLNVYITPRIDVFFKTCYYIVVSLCKQLKSFSIQAKMKGKIVQLEKSE